MARTLAFGDDQSQSADVAWLWVTSHDWPGWQVEVVTAIGPSDTPGQAQPRAPRHPRRLLGSADTPVRHQQVAAEPVAALSGLPDRDLLVVGPRGHGLRKALHIGSVCEALIHHPPMPLLVARHGVPTTRAVVCADGSPDSRRAAAVLGMMPWLGGVDVLVAAVPTGQADAVAASRDTARQLAPGARSVSTQVLDINERDLVVNVRAMLLSAAEQWQADLLVLGTRGLSGMAALAAGSIATSVASHAPCSVLLARAG